MERRVTSHTEEEEMNQRRRLLTLARKGDQKAIDSLFELYQVRVFSGEALKKKKLPSFPLPNQIGSSGKGMGKSGKKMVKIPKLSSSEAIPKPVLAKLAHKSKKKTGLSTKLTGKQKGAKPSPEKPKKGRPLSSQKVAHKARSASKIAPVSKSKQKKATLTARPTRVKKK
jgi:hypothetical protein